MENPSDVESAFQNSLTGWFQVKAQSTEIPAYCVLQDNESYFGSRLPRLEKKITSELHRIIHSGKRSDGGESHTQEDERGDLLNQLNLMPLEILSAYVDSETKRLKGAEADLNQKRSKGMHKAAAKTEKFAMAFDRFLKAYSGIVAIVNMVDAQYGGVACATLSLLFATVKLKAEGEKSIISSMDQISDRLPDFKVYQRIYPDPSLGLMLAVAYKDVILLAREATCYFQSSGFVRHIHSMGKPLQFQLMEEEMRKNFSRIRLKCETLLAQRVDELVAKIEDMQSREDTKIVIEMRNTLKLGDYRVEDMREGLENYRGILKALFDSDRHRQKMGLSDFLTAVGQDWESKGSLLLVLFGCNEIGISTVSQSWLSPIAVDLIKDLLETSRTVAYEICTKSSTLVGVLSRLIFQLLEKSPNVVRRGNDLRDIESQLSREGDDKVKALLTASSRIISLQNERVFIVLDRPDLCEQGSQAAEFIQAMLSLVKDAISDLKIVLVQRSELWDVEKNLGKDTQRVSQKMFQTMRLDQCRI
ncbi:hypothetical protein N431DRAFT_464323 [Stipitochalara longipes BDJ]|nr:hypothetical protein N431DRAFT_464323 [Stipitochalara longipes BDJ]